jgi:hypothetical protein
MKIKLHCEYEWLIIESPTGEVISIAWDEIEKKFNIQNKEDKIFFKGDKLLD